nr:MAG TPA: ATP dependent DNA helicase [Caudoviricetes sp.]
MKTKIHCKVVRNVFTNNDGTFSIYGCVPSTNDLDKIHLNKYGNFTLKGNLSLLEVGEDYTVEVEEKSGSYGYEYWLVGFPEIEDFDVSDVKEITDDQEAEMLKFFMTLSQAKYVHEAYPNFIRLVLMGEQDKIDYKNIHNVAEIRLKGYINKVNERFKYYKLHLDNPQYELSIGDCGTLCSTYSTIQESNLALATKPYEVLIDVLDRGFQEADRMICEYDNKWEDSEARCLYLTCYLLECNEEDGNTRINGVQIANVINQYNPQLNKHIVELVEKSGKIYYDNQTKDLSLMRTYLAECNIAQTIKQKVAHSAKWNIDIEKYRNNESITLTDEQSKILDLVCNYDFGMLIGSAGCVDTETEFFNGTQWKKISEYEQGDKVLQYNQDGTAELVYPERYIKEPCNEMYHFETKYGLNQTLTRDHRIIYYSKKGVLHNESLEEIMKIHNTNSWGFHGKFMTTFKYDGQGIDLTDDEIRIMCAVIANGSFYSIAKPHQPSYHTCRFHIKKERKKERLRLLFDSAKIKYKEISSKNEGYTDFYIIPPRREKEFTSYWYNCTNEQLNIICDEIMFWDGSVGATKNGVERKRFSTSIKQSAEFVQFAFSACGYRASLSEKNRIGRTYITGGKEYIRKSKEYNVTVTKRNLVGLYKGNNKDLFQKVVPSDGYKYCFTVPSHMLVLRRKNQIFITGNSGKSSSVKALINLLEDNQKTYTLLAPSGIAAKRLRETTGREASTIHRKLMSSNEIDSNVVVVDEVSMVDVHLFSTLLNQIADYTKIILVFDSAQLASIQCGNLVQDMMDSHVVPNAQLTKVFRYGVGGIATVGADARNGKEYLTSTGELNCENASKIKDYKFIQVNDNPLEQVLAEYDKLKQKYNTKDILILTPYNKGEFGTYAINQAIQEKYNPANPMDNIVSRKLPPSLRVPMECLNYHIGDKVINKKNNYHAMTEEGFNYYTTTMQMQADIDKLKVQFGANDERVLEAEDKLMALNMERVEETTVYNGDIGFIQNIDAKGNVWVQFDEEMVVYRKSDLENLLLAYACTSHASQGCEAKGVIFLTHPSQKRMLSRNLCYMSLTRAKEMLVEIGDVSTINSALRVNETRLRDTWLKELLKEGSDVKR